MRFNNLQRLIGICVEIVNILDPAKEPCRPAAKPKTSHESNGAQACVMNA